MHLPSDLLLPFSFDYLHVGCKAQLQPYHLAHQGLVDLLHFEHRLGPDCHLTSYLMAVPNGHQCPVQEENTKQLVPIGLPQNQKVDAPPLPLGPVSIRFQLSYREYMTYLLQHDAYAARKVNFQSLLPQTEDIMLLMKGKEEQALGTNDDWFHLTLQRQGPHHVLLKLQASIILQPFIQGG